jgi:ribosomal protein S6--L-glutamate ligase
MKLGILSCSPLCYSTRRLKEAAASRGHTVKVLNTLKFAIDLNPGSPDLFYCNKPLSRYDAVLPRIGASITYYGTAVVRQFEQLDVFCGNSSNAITNSRDKLRSMQILSRHQIGIPPTTFVRDRSDVVPAIERVGGAPVVIKLLEGTQGVGVILAETLKVAEAIIETLQSTRQNVLVQKFISECRGRDIRAFVVGDQVVAAMRRVAQGQEFRSNVHRGGRAESVQLDEHYCETAVRAAQIMGLRIAGVDLLEADDGPKVMEVNSSPGLEGIEQATGLDVAGAVIDFLAAQVNFPELDIRQRLTVSRGYGVAELSIPEGSEYVGKTIAESGLNERDVNVLTLHRETSVIPNPRPGRILEAGDRLLCFGRLDSMRDLVSARTRRARKLNIRKLPGEASTTHSAPSTPSVSSAPPATEALVHTAAPHTLPEELHPHRALNEPASPKTPAGTPGDPGMPAQSASIR